MQMLLRWLRRSLRLSTCPSGSVRSALTSTRRAKAGKLIIRGAIECGEYDFLVGLLCVFVIPGEVTGHFLKEVVGVDVDEQVQEGAKLRSGE